MSSSKSAVRSARTRLAVLALSCMFGASLIAPSAASAGCFLVVFCSPATPPPPPPPPAVVHSQVYGFHDMSWGNTSLYPQATQLSGMAKAGAKYWRTGLSWQYWEPYENQTDQWFLPAAQNEYTKMLANGQTPVFLVMGTPYWAVGTAGQGASKGRFLCAPNNNQTPCVAPPDVRNQHILEKWQHFLQVMAYAMPKAVFEIWNEPNIDWSWLQPQDPELYGLMLKSAGEAIHAISPTTKVISGGLNAYSLQDTSVATGNSSFIRRMYSVAPKSSFDGLGFHTYPCGGTNPAAWTPIVSQVIAQTRAARDAAGDPTKPMWVTETGATTGAATSTHCGSYFTEANQGPAIAATLKVLQESNDANHDIPVVLVNSLFNLYQRANFGGTSNNLAEGEFGLIASVRNPLSNQVTYKNKPAYAKVVCKFNYTC